jgi:hypothetical protein
MQLILNGDTRPILFFLTAAADHIAGITGASPSVAISKNGAAFVAPAGAVSEVGDGWYKLTPAGADVATNGVLVLHAGAAGADPADVKCQVVAFDPYDTAPSLPEITGGVLRTPLPESYSGNGQEGTLTQLLYGLTAILGNVSQSGDVLTANRLDGETPAMSFLLDSATAPSSRRRSD